MRIQDLLKGNFAGYFPVGRRAETGKQNEPFIALGSGICMCEITFSCLSDHILLKY